MFELLKTLKKYYGLAALTNIGKEWLDYKREKFRLDEYFDEIISSAYEGLQSRVQKFTRLQLKN